MKKVTDPALLQQLEGKAIGKKVTDPALLSQLDEQPRQSLVHRAAQAASGVIEGLAALPTLPFDLARAGGRAIGIPERFLPYGSEALRSTLQDVGITQPPPQSGLDRVLRRAGSDVGATMVPLGATLRAARTAPAIMPAIGTLRSIFRQTVDAARRDPGKFSAIDVGLSTATGTGAGIAGEIFPDQPGAEIAGSLLPIAAPAAAGGLVRQFLRGSDSSGLQRSIQDFGRFGASPTVGQGTGLRRTDVLEATVQKGPISGPIYRRTQDTAEKIGKQIDNIAFGLSPRSGKIESGKAISKGIVGEDGFIQRFQATQGKLYGELDKFIKPDTPVDMSRTQKALDNLSKSVRDAPELSKQLGNQKLDAIREAFVKDAKGNQLPYRAVKELRSKIGSMLDSTELISQAPRASLKRLYAAWSQDMFDAAKSAGPQAERLARRANEYTRAGHSRIDNFLEDIGSKARPEDIHKFVMSGTRDGDTRLRAIMRSLKPEQRRVIAATEVRELGRATPGKQSAEGELFSTETFLTNWNRLPESTKRTLFAGPEMGTLKTDLDTVARVAARIRESANTLPNPSGTATNIANIITLSSGLTGVFTGNLPVAATAAGYAGLNYSMSRLMASPKFVRWLAQATRIPAERLPAHITRLSNALRNEDLEIKEAAQVYLEALNKLSTQAP